MTHSFVKRLGTPRVLRVLIWVAVLLPLVGGLAITGYYAVATPGCVRCHDESSFVEATEAAPHAAVECAECHVPSGPVDRVAFGFRQAFHMSIPLMDGGGRDWSAVPDSRCLACHVDVTKMVTEARGLRIAHETCAAESECTDCHATTAHGAATDWARTFDMQTCLGCHLNEDASSDCGLCHEGQLPEDRITTGVFAITHGKEWQRTHGMGDSDTCSACHTAASCADCHGAGLPHEPQFLEVHAQYATSSTQKCASCHEQRFCDSCHGTPMPHTRAFTRDHRLEVEKDEALCKRCHLKEDCDNCHLTHVHPGGAI